MDSQSTCLIYCFESKTMKSKVVTIFIYLHDSFYKEIPLEMHGKIVFSLKNKKNKKSLQQISIALQ